MKFYVSAFLFLFYFQSRSQTDKFIQTNPDVLAGKSYLYLDPVNLTMTHAQVIKAGIKEMLVNEFDQNDSSGIPFKKTIMKFSAAGFLVYRGTAMYEMKVKNKKYDSLSVERFQSINDTVLKKTESWPGEKGLEKTRMGILFFNRNGFLIKDSTIHITAKDTVTEKYFYANGQMVKRMVFSKRKVSSVHYYYWSGTKLDSYKDENRNNNIFYQLDFDSLGRYSQKRVKGGVGGETHYNYYYGNENELTKVTLTQSNEKTLELSYIYDEKGLIKKCFVEHYKEPVYKYRYEVEYKLR
ncbi:MAG: hypothetical protein IAF38_00280 [Bacteroidia bacterium]|nr:hypothetical protein [Bacteroidia bacterium]